MSRWHRAIVGLVGTATIVATILAGVSHRENRLEAVSWVWGVVGGIVALALALAPWAGRPAFSAAKPVSSDVLEILAEAIAVQWRSESEARRISRRTLIPLEWRAADPHLLDRNLDRVDLAKINFGTSADLIDIFLSLPARRLAIVGEPGAGKTVLSLVLTLDLLRRRSPGDAVPVIFTAASWNPRQQHVHAWMAERLQETYVWLRDPGPVAGSTLAMWLIQTRQIVPILDGLDEIADHLAHEALRSLNRAYGAIGDIADPIVLTCRTASYTEGLQALGEPLSNTAVISLIPLRPEETAAYLSSERNEPAAAHWSAIAAAIRSDPDGPIAQALSTPLMLALLKLAYGRADTDPGKLLDARFTDRGDVERELLDHLVASVYEDGTTAQTPFGGQPKTVERWLRYLANSPHVTETKEIAWWELGRRLPAYLHWLIFGAATGVVGALSFGDLAGAAPAYVTGLAIFAAAQVIGRVGSVSLPTMISPQMRTGMERLARGFILGLAAGIALELILGLRPYAAITAGGAVGLAGGLAAGIALLVEQPPDVSAAATPSMVLRFDQMALLARVFVIGPFGGLAVGLAIGLNSDAGLSLAARTGVVVGLALGLGTCVIVASRLNLAAGIGAGLGLGAFGGVLTGLMLSRSPATGAEMAVTIAVCMWAEISLALVFTSAWGRYAVMHVWASLNADLPWRLFRFFDDAHRRGVLRQDGAFYQFRHLALQERLSNAGR